MTRWQKFGWALGYSVLSLLSMVWMVFGNMVQPPGQVMLLYFVLGALPVWELGLGIGLLTPLFVYAAGLLLVPVMAAFRRYWPLWTMLILGMTGRLVMLVVCLSGGDMADLAPTLMAFVRSVFYSLLTARLFRYPDPAQGAPEETQPRWFRRRRRFHGGESGEKSSAAS